MTEETAPDLLLDEFTVEECSTMFYTNPTAEFAQRTHEVLEALKAATSLPQDQRAARLAELRGSLRELMDSIKGGHSVRPDGTILHPASQETVWFDTAGTHTTCTSHLVAEHKHTLARRAAGRDGARMASARLLEEYRIKIDRYALLAAIAERQLLDGMRPVAPLVLPVVVSTTVSFVRVPLSCKSGLSRSTAFASSSRVPVTTVRCPRTLRRAFGASCARPCCSQ